MSATVSDPAAEPEPTPGRWRRFQLLPKPMRVGTYLTVGLVLLLVVVSIVGVVLVRRPFPQTTGTIAVPGLGDRVEVVRDGYGIPQIYASSTADLMYAEGYVHAQERFFEMDVRRHATAGTLAELLGAKALPSDVYVRTMGWRRVAARELAMLQPETRAALDSYADGVNAYLDSHSPSQISLEYTLLDADGRDYTPAPWTPVDSLSWLKALAWDLRGNMQQEIDRVEDTAAVGARRTRQLFPAYSQQHTPIVDQGQVVDGAYEPNARTPRPGRVLRRPAPFGEQALRRLDQVGRGLDSLSYLGAGTSGSASDGVGVGSNSWVVDGTMTASGKPLLANDPHLSVSLPGIWMQVGLHCTTVDDDCPYDVSGFSFSGVPGVIIGHNDRIAWGFTNLGADVTDLYVERIVGDRYRYGGQLLPLRTRQETFQVAGGDPITITVRSTRHGPIVSDADDELRAVAGESPVARAAPSGDEDAISLEWTALQPHPTADAILELDRAQDFDGFRKAAADFAVPAQNMVYADVDGNIGYQAPGLVPIRRSGNDGLQPAAGWRPQDDWSGQYVPFAALPNVYNPRDHFIATANQEVVGPTYPYYLTDDWDHGYRSQRIRDLLQGRTGLTVDDMGSLQMDSESPLADALLPILLRLHLPRGYDSTGQRLLVGWDGQQGADSAPAAYFNAVWRNLLALTFHDDLPESQWPDGGQRWVAVVLRLLQEPDSKWWDDVTTDGVREDRNDVLIQAMTDARDELTERIGPDKRDWSWGALHRLPLHSQTLGASGIDPVEALFNRGSDPVGGSGSAVDATSWDASADDYAVTTAPSMRMVVDLADLDDSRWIDLTGVSGHAFDAHYDDQTPLWLAGQTLPWPSSPDAVHAAGEDTLTLEPTPAG